MSTRLLKIRIWMPNFSKVWKIKSKLILKFYLLDWLKQQRKISWQTQLFTDFNKAFLPLLSVAIGSDFGLDFFQIRFEIVDLDWISNPIFALGFGLDFKSKCSGFLKGLQECRLIGRGREKGEGVEY